MSANRRWLAVVFCCAAMGADEPGEKPAAAPVVAESAPVETDGVAVSVVLEQKSFAADAQPTFKVRFKNVGTEYRNLYNVAAYWNWTIVLTNTDPLAASWRLRMNSIPLRRPIDHRQIKPGESTDVAIDLNEPPFTLAFVPEPPSPDDKSKPPADSKQRPARHLPPGHYKLTAVVSLEHPFGEGHKQWTGPVTTRPVEVTITAVPEKKESREERAAYDAAIRRVTDNLDPNGLWLNGVSPRISADRNSQPEVVVDEMVNVSTINSKAYRVLRVHSFDKGGSASHGSAALVRVDNSYKVAIFFSFETGGWWSRFYDTQVELPAKTAP
jgi:hypothetical protein